MSACPKLRPVPDPVFERDPAERHRLLVRLRVAPRAHLARKGHNIHCGPEEVVVVLQGGQVQTVLEPGTAAVASLPIDTDEPVDLCFVSTAAQEIALRLTGTFADPAGSGPCTVRIGAVLLVRVHEPARFCTNLVVGQIADAVDAIEGFIGYRADRLAGEALRHAVGEAIAAQGSVLAVVDGARAGSLLQPALDPLQDWLSRVGLRLHGLAEASLELDPASRRRLAPRPTAAPARSPAVPPGARVLVRWADGKQYTATTLRYQSGCYEVQLDGGPSAWVQERFLQPAAS